MQSLERQVRTENQLGPMFDQSESSLVLRDVDYRDMLSVVPGYAIIVDSDRRVRWVNRAPTARSIGEVIGADLLEFVIEEQRSLVGDALAQIWAGAAGQELEVQSAATLHWYSLRLMGIVQRGSVLGTFIHALDIDDAKRAQTELAIQRARLASLNAEISPAQDHVERPNFELMVDALPMLISYVDREQRYQHNNAAYERWFGSSRESMRGRRIADVLGPEAFAEIRPYVEAALSGRTVRFETTIPYRGAGLRRVIARYVPAFDAEGTVAGFYVVVEDVSAQREVEQTLRQRDEQLRQLQKMEALGRLAGGIAHEFGNLLMTVLSGCTAVAELVTPDTPAAGMVAQVKRAAQRGSSLTRQLLSFSRGSELRQGPLELDVVVGDMVVLLDRLLGSPIELEVDLSANAWILADAGQIQQVLMNLALNARDAMPEGGRLRVTTTLVQLTPEQTREHGSPESGARALLSVSDTGMGMDERTRARIFDPFFTTKPPGVGTGLGLSTVYGIVRQAGGHIEVESAPGLGSVFRLYFPTCSPGSSEPDPQ
jgi:PAS domain S-box-containing protein